MSAAAAACRRVRRGRGTGVVWVGQTGGAGEQAGGGAVWRSSMQSATQPPSPPHLCCRGEHSKLLHKLFAALLHGHCGAPHILALVSPQQPRIPLRNLLQAGRRAASAAGGGVTLGSSGLEMKSPGGQRGLQGWCAGSSSRRRRGSRGGGERSGDRRPCLGEWLVGRRGAAQANRVARQAGGQLSKDAGVAPGCQRGLQVLQSMAAGQGGRDVWVRLVAAEAGQRSMRGWSAQRASVTAGSEQLPALCIPATGVHVPRPTAQRNTTKRSAAHTHTHTPADQSCIPRAARPAAPRSHSPAAARACSQPAGPAAEASESGRPSQLA